jgi:hypothetical protein
MSKILRNLKGVSDLRGQKFTKVLQAQNGDAQENQKERLDSSSQINENTVVLDKNIWYLSMVCVAFMGLIAIVLSFKAFAQIQRGHTNVVKLSKIILKQRSDIEKLNLAVSEMQHRQGNSIRNNALSFTDDKQNNLVENLNNNLNNFNAEIEDLKKEHQRLLSKLVDLNGEVKRLKTDKYSKN